MIVDLAVDVVMWIVELVAAMLPTHEVTISSDGAGSIVSGIAQLDSLVPIAGPLAAAVVLLGFAVVFVAVRLILMARHVLLP